MRVLLVASVVAGLLTTAQAAAAGAGPRTSIRRDHGRLAGSLRDDAGLEDASGNYRPTSGTAPDTADRVHVLVSGSDSAAIQGAVEANGGVVNASVADIVDSVGSGGAPRNAQ